MSNYDNLINKVNEIKEFKEFKNKYMLLKNKIAEIEAIEEECGKEILKNNIFNINEEGYKLRLKRNPNLDKRILESNESYLMNKEDLEKYLKLLHEARTEKGIKAKDWENSSTFVLFEEMKKYEHGLVNITIELAPIEIKEKIVQLFNNYKYRDKAIETMINVK